MPTQEFVCDIPTQRVLHSKTPRRDQNPVLAISSFGLIKNTRHAIIVTAKLPRARLSSGRSNESVGHIPRTQRLHSKTPRKDGSRNLFLRAGQINCAGHADRHASCYERCFTWLYRCSYRRTPNETRGKETFVSDYYSSVGSQNNRAIKMNRKRRNPVPLKRAL